MKAIPPALESLESTETPFCVYRASLDDGHCEYISSGCVALTGYTPDELRAQPLLTRDLVHPEWRAKYDLAWKRTASGEMPPPYTYVLIDRHGRERHLCQRNAVVFDDRRQPIAIEGFVSEFFDRRGDTSQSARVLPAEMAELMFVNQRLREEIVTRRHALARLRDREAQLRLLTDNLPAMISYVDANERYRFNNRAYEERFGWAREEIYGKTVRELIGDATYREVEDKIKAALAGIKTSFTVSTRDRDGGVRHMHASFIPHWDESHHRVKGFFALIDDISDVKQAEANVRRDLLEAAHAARVSTVGQMASQVTHELAQPLAAIGNYSAICSTLLARRQFDVLGEAIQKLGAQSKRALGIIHGLKDFLRKGNAENRVVDLAALAQNALRLIQWEAEARGVPLRFEAPGPLPAICVDSTLIEQVIVNLLRNALDATGSEVTRERPITVCIDKRDSAIELAVQDCGPGLPAELKARLFEPFFTTKQDGLGIGLAICRRIIESYGGRLWADDNPGGRGAVFRFSLPFSESTAPEETPKNS